MKQKKPSEKIAPKPDPAWLTLPSVPPVEIPKVKCSVCDHIWTPTKSLVKRCPKCSHMLKPRPIELPTRTCQKCNAHWNPKTPKSVECPRCGSRSWMVGPDGKIVAEATPVPVKAIMALAVVLLMVMVSVPSYGSASVSPHVATASCSNTNPIYCDNLTISGNWTTPYVFMNGSMPFIYLDFGSNASSRYSYTGWADTNLSGSGWYIAAFNMVNWSIVQGSPCGATVGSLNENMSYVANMTQFVKQFGYNISGGLGYSPYGGVCAPAGGNPEKIYANITYAAAVIFEVDGQRGWQVNISNPMQLQFRYAPKLSVLATNSTPANGSRDRFTTSASLGAPPYFYQWFVNGTRISNTTANASIAFNSTGEKQVRVEIHDVGKGWANATTYVNVTPALSAPPNVIAGTSRAKLDVGQFANLSMSASGGIPPYTYQWLLNGTSVARAGATYQFVPTGAALYHFNATVTGKNGKTGWDELNETVYGRLSSALASSGQDVAIGSPVTLTDSINGGTISYNYVWTLNGTVIAGINAPSIAYTPKGAATYVFTVNVTDGNGEYSNSSFNLTAVSVYQKPTVSLSLSHNAIDLGTTVWANATVLGGQAPFTYLWKQTDGSIVGTGASVQFIASTAGTAWVNLTITDAQSGTASAASTVQVYPTLALASTVKPMELYVGQTINGSMSVSGGHGPYSLEWSLNGSMAYSTTNFSFIPKGVGNYSFQASVSDSLGSHAGGLLYKVQVAPLGSYILPTVSSIQSRNSFDQGQTVTLTATTTYGQAPFHYQWNTGILSSSGSGGNVTVTASGITARTSVTWSVTVTDAKANSATAYGNLTVYPQLSVTASVSYAANGESANLTETALGGNGSYAYAWTVATNGSAQSYTTQAISITNAGFYRWSLKATDGNGESAWSNGTLKLPQSSPLPVARGPPIFAWIYSEEGLLVIGPAVAIMVIFVGYAFYRSRKSESDEGDSISAPPEPTKGADEWDEGKEPTPLDLPPSSATVAPSVVPFCSHCGEPRVAGNTICPECYTYYEPPKGGAWRMKKKLPKVTEGKPSPPSPPATLEKPEDKAPVVEKTPSVTPTLPPELQHLKDEMEKVLEAASAPPAEVKSTIPPVDGVHTIGETRSETNPLPEIRPEDVNPNVSHIDPALLQPMEMRITQDRGTDVRNTTLPENETPSEKAERLMAQASASRRKSRFGVQQAEKPTGEQ